MAVTDFRVKRSNQLATWFETYRFESLFRLNPTGRVAGCGQYGWASIAERSEPLGITSWPDHSRAVTTRRSRDHRILSRFAKLWRAHISWMFDATREEPPRE